MEVQLEGSTVAEFLKRLCADQQWTGTMTDLLHAVNEQLDEEYNYVAADAATVRRERWWPKTPNNLSGQVTRLAPALRSAGYTVESCRPQRGATKVWTLRGPRAGK